MPQCKRDRCNCAHDDRCLPEHPADQRFQIAVSLAILRIETLIESRKAGIHIGSQVAEALIDLLVGAIEMFDTRFEG